MTERCVTTYVAIRYFVMLIQQRAIHVTRHQLILGGSSPRTMLQPLADTPCGAHYGGRTPHQGGDFRLWLLHRIDDGADTIARERLPECANRRLAKFPHGSRLARLSVAGIRPTLVQAASLTITKMSLKADLKKRMCRA